jgi:Xaa-Pro aminopeptidase
MYQKHREQLLATLGASRTAAIIPTSPTRTRNADSEFRFRPSSDFWYLTGFAEPGSVLLLLPAGTESDEQARSILFLRERDALLETWNGRRVGLERAPDQLGVDEARDIEDLWEVLPQLLKGYESLMVRSGEEEEFDREMLGVVRKLRARARGATQAPLEIVDPMKFLHEQRLTKNEAELDLMRKAADITRQAHVGSMALTKPGVHEYEVDAFIDYTFRRNGSTGQAYTSIVAGGENACILHYIENNQELKDGDLLLIDAGSEVEYYASDVTRTFPVSGTFSPAQKEIYELVLESELAGIERVKPGVPHKEIHAASLAVLVRGFLRLGLLKGTEESVIEDESYKRFFMHGTSHWLGLDVHDCGAYNEAGESRPIQAGMVFTVEPGVYIAADDELVDARWRGIGVRIEDDVLVTETGYEVLTQAIPKTVEDVEAACRGKALEPAL